MTREQRAKISAVLRYIVLVLVGVIMVYPLIWMVGATFKTNSEIFTSAWFWPKNPVFDGYSQAFKSYGGKIDLLHSMLNTYKIVIPKVIFTLLSATITAYGFARFNFKGKNIFFALLMCTLFLPQVVLNAPQYIMFNKWGWTDSYLPLVIPSLFACDTYFVFMLNQFLRGIPRELEEAAKIDGCNAVQTLWYVIVPMTKYTNSIYLRMSMDGDVGFQWNRILAMSLISIIPSLIVFFASQNSFVEGISAGGVKG
jgi:oligogalacturonide transport system permease protein